MRNRKLSSEWRDASSLGDIKEFLKSTSLETSLIDWLQSDRRIGVRALAKQVSRQLERLESERERLHSLLSHERKLMAQGYQAIAGVDEVGAGPLAGPVVAAAVILDLSEPINHVKDSKKLSAKLRSQIDTELRTRARAFALGWVEPSEIDDINVYQASLLAMQRAVTNLDIKPDHLLVDARTIPNLSCPQKAIIGGDNVSYAIGAASILAKEARDRFMKDIDKRYPGYGFAKHKGYGTRIHIEALKRLGPSPIHRMSFAPVAAASNRALLDSLS